MDADAMCGVAVARRGGVIAAERTGGMADRSLGLACTPQTRFQIASVSKHFTAAAVLLLASRSQLSLDDPVSRWFGGCPDDWQAITLHHLLTHTSGLIHLGDLPALDLYRPIEPTQELSIFQQQSLLFAPGSRYSYSRPGYTLLAWIVEKTGGQPYASFLADQIFAPLGMTSAPVGACRLRNRPANSPRILESFCSIRCLAAVPQLPKSVSSRICPRNSRIPHKMG
jgi:CubicO group peptidase (beta-lactamase class C family)